MLSGVGRWRVFAIAWVSLSVLSALWALAVPIASVPDEPAHFIKAASVVRGQFIGTPSDDGHVVLVPSWVAETHLRTCSAFAPESTGECQYQELGGADELVEAPTTAGLYNPVYYLAIGWPSLMLSGDSGLYGMRIASAIFSSLFLALTVMIVLSWRNRSLAPIGILVAATPMLLYLSGAVNPNAVEASATAALFAAMLGCLAYRDDRLLAERAAIVAISAAVAANTRGLAMVWVLLAIALPFLWVPLAQAKQLLKRRPVLTAIAVVAVAVAFSLLWLFGSSSLFAGLDDPADAEDVPLQGQSPIRGMWIVLSGTLSFGRELVGYFGWLDTPAHELVYFVWAVFAGVSLVLVIVLLRGRRLWIALSLTASFLLIPAVLQGIYITGGGFIWQGRYSLPLFAIATIGIWSLLDDELRARISRNTRSRIVVLALVLWTGCQLLGFATTLKRYAVGINGGWKAALFDPIWNPPLGSLALVIVFALSVIAAAGLLARFLLTDPVEKAAISTRVD